VSRVAVFVDAGYVFAQGSVLLAGKKLPRGGTSLDHAAAIATVLAIAERVAAVPLLPIPPRAIGSSTARRPRKY
jgi:hypothetical protein